VPGDVLVISEGDRVCADGRIIDGTAVLDLSALTGESAPTNRSVDPDAVVGSLLEARNLVFSGTTCAGGEVSVVVTAPVCTPSEVESPPCRSAGQASGAHSNVRCAGPPGSSPWLRSGSARPSGRPVLPRAWGGAQQ
jgi:hypothetical protein